MTICIWLPFCKKSFQLGSILFLQISMTICIWLLFIEEFSIRISSLPTNSFDDLHLPTLWEGSFQLGSIPFLQIPMTMCIWLDVNLNLLPFL